MGFEYLRTIAEGSGDPSFCTMTENATEGLDEASLKEYKSEYDRARSRGLNRRNSIQLSIATNVFRDAMETDQKQKRELNQLHDANARREKAEKKAEKQQKKRRKNEDASDGFNFADLHAISEGYDPDIVAIYGGDSCFAIDEAFSRAAKAKNARQKSKDILKGGTMKDVMTSFRKAKQLAKSGRKEESLAECDKAIAGLKRLRAEAETLDDDILEEIYSDEAYKSLAIIFAGWLALFASTFALPVMPAVSAAASAGGFIAFIAGAVKSVVDEREYHKAVFRSKTVKQGTYINGKWTSDFHTVSDSRDMALEKLDDLINACETLRNQVSSTT